MKKRALLIFTSNLRILDNHIFTYAPSDQFDISNLAFISSDRSELQKNYQIQSAIELRDQFLKFKLPFLIIEGRDMCEAILETVRSNSIDKVIIQDSYNSRDKMKIAKLEKNLGDKIQTFFQQTLIETKDLPFPIEETPLVFTQFKKCVLDKVQILKPIQTDMSDYSGFELHLPEKIKSLEVKVMNSAKFKLPFGITAGESGALARLQDYFWTTQSLINYKQTRNGMLEMNDSSKFSIGLSHGTVSVRKIYSELLKFEQLYGKNESTEWFVLELLWRDYFKFLALKIGPQLFSRKGLKDTVNHKGSDPNIFDHWCQGQTRQDFIDANMNELNQTGWMSNRGRQNVASYLAKTLNVDWTLGAQYFEKNLIDDDVESNWGNWLYLAGVGTDPRDRVFNIERQADIYDSDRKYRDRWLEVL